MKRVFVGTDYRRLPIVFNRDVCIDTPAKPKSWNTQLQIVQKIGKSFPGEVVRVDLYGGGEKVWFSEFTFTTAGCWKRFTPALTDGLLYGLMKNKLSSDVVTPEYVEQILTDESWVMISLDEKRQFIPELHAAYPSPVDLCQFIEEFGETLSNNGKLQLRKKTKEQLFRRCINAAKKVQTSSLRCIVCINNGTQIESFGVNGFSERGKSTSNIDICADQVVTV